MELSRMIPKAELDSLTDDQLLELAKTGAKNIASDIPDKIDPASVSTRATIPFRALVIRTVMRARLAELTTAACDLFSRDARVSAFILTRSFLESVAIVYAINDRMLRAIDEGKVGDSGKIFERLGWGSRSDLTPAEAINTLTLISKLDRKYPEMQVQEQFDNLSEVAHPNWGGVIGSYSQFDPTDLYEVIDKHGTLLPATLGLKALVTAISIFENIYNVTILLLPDFSKLCESALDGEN